MATIRVHPRPTPAERSNEQIDVEVDEALSLIVASLEDWAEPRQMWTLEIREGHDRGRANNVVAELLYAGGDQTSSLSFRLDQVDAIDDTGAELVIRFDEHDGIAKLATLRSDGLDVELFHILTFT